MGHGGKILKAGITVHQKKTKITIIITIIKVTIIKCSMEMTLDTFIVHDFSCGCRVQILFSPNFTKLWSQKDYSAKIDCLGAAQRS